MASVIYSFSCAYAVLKFISRLITDSSGPSEGKLIHFFVMMPGLKYCSEKNEVSIIVVRRISWRKRIKTL